MPKYEVTVELRTRYEYTIEADTESEAQAEGEDRAGDELCMFDCDIEVYSTLVDVEE